MHEVSLPNSPGHSMDAVLDQVSEKLTTELAARSDTTPVPDNRTLRPKPNMAGGESGSDGGNRTETRRTTGPVPAPPLMTRQSSAMSSKQGKGKAAGEGSTQHMTVETETVSSIPQVALAPATSTVTGTGTLKHKPSTETIKPKKEKKKPGRKQQPVHTGNGEPTHSSSHFLNEPQRRRPVPALAGATEDYLAPTRIYGQGPQIDEPTSPRHAPSRTSRHSSLAFYPVSNILTRPRVASSKADVFEATIASAVDEADTSDSEETFVYDSNPPDADRQRRFHSRTPSATSMMSQQDRNAMRSIHSVIESSGPPVTLKKTMKFANTYSSNGDSVVGDDDGKGTARSNAGSARGTARQHHHAHFGRWGRSGGNGHASLFDNESPFPNAAKTKLSGTTSRQSSGPPSPRVNNSGRGAASSKRSMIQHASSVYDLDDATGADDERTPLMSGTVRSTQSRRGRRQPVFRRDLERQSYRQGPSYLNRFAACLVVTMMLLLVITGAIGFMFATSQPLTEIELVAIKNVLASGPELMFDLTVKAHNPNVVVVSIDQANLEIFAKSPHAGSDSEWWKNPQGPPRDRPTSHDGSEVHITDDPPDDPPDDDTAPNMRLGTITEFDNPLSFEGSFFHHGISTSTGELRLQLPGNNTAGGSERWERIIQDEFDLVVKGILRYSLPLSQRVRSAAISGRATVKPNSANDPLLRPNSTTLTP